MRRRFAVIAAILLVLASGGYALASNAVYDSVSTIDKGWCPAHFGADTPAHFSTRDMDRATAVDITPYAMPDYSTVTFPSRGGQVTISGWWVPGASTTSPAVVLVHGWGKCRHDPEVLLPAGMLHRHGFGVLLIDLRNHGDSGSDDGRFAGGVKEYRDVLGAWDWLRNEQHLPSAKIGLLGVSLGGGTVLMAMGDEPSVAAVWEDSGFADVEVGMADELARRGYPTLLEPGGIIAGRILHGVDLTSLSPLRAIAKVPPRPIAIVHGTADTRVPPKHAAMLAAAIRAHGGSVDPWLLPGVTHVRAAFVATAEYERRLTAFFTSALGPAT